jgi:serine/threonine protein kinase
MTDAAASNQSPLPVRKVAGLRLVEQVTRGGMAEIWRAANGVGEQVIVRRLRRKWACNWRMQQRFREGMAVRRRMGVHPRVVCYLGQHGWLRPCEVVEYVDGDSLKYLITRRHRLVVEQPLELLLQAAEGLVHVQSCGYLHLDIKPENYLIRFERGGFRLKLTDFDFCRPVDTRQVPRRFGGSLLYVPPEFLLRKAVAPETDVFSFGVMAYQVLTFQLPFVASSQELLKQRDGEVPMAATSRVGEEAGRWLRRCLHVNPERRFSSAEAMLRGLERVLATEGEPRYGSNRPG